MNYDRDDAVSALLAAAAQELDDARERIHHCLEQLTDEQVGRRPSPGMNSITNLLLHLCGNLRQWILSGLGGQPDVRNRPQEFADQVPITKSELLRRLDETVAECRQTILGLSPAELTRVRRIQAHDLSAAAALWDCIPHFRGHAQEIIHMTRGMLGDKYRFAFVPQTREQGGPV
ncbi:MAG TPA: DUF1572 family protein [Pirellulaceae bacterium]|nr:DUF1572 family protein [Pirellulaceae bacterium]